MPKKISNNEVARVFAEEYSEVLSWRARKPHSGEPHCWFVDGRLDEYGLSALNLCVDFLKKVTYRDPLRFGFDIRDERAYEILDRAKKLLMVKRES